MNPGLASLPEQCILNMVGSGISRLKGIEESILEKVKTRLGPPDKSCT